MRHSVIIPAYNASLYIEACMGSVLPQLGPADEVIIVNDGSVDDTWSIISNMRDSRIQTIDRAQNLGMTATRNQALSIATGDYIHFMDHDDLWPNNRIEVIEATIKAHAPDLISGQVEHFFCPTLSEADRQAFFLPKPQAAALSGSIIINRLALSRLGLFNTTLSSGEFIDLLSRALAMKLKWVKIEQLLFYRRIHGKNHTLFDGQAASSYMAVIRLHMARRQTK